MKSPKGSISLEMLKKVNKKSLTKLKMTKKFKINNTFLDTLFFELGFSCNLNYKRVRGTHSVFLILQIQHKCSLCLLVCDEYSVPREADFKTVLLLTDPC